MKKYLLISACCFALAAPVMAEEGEVQVSMQEEEYGEMEEELPEETEDKKDSGWSFSKWSRSKDEIKE